MAFKDWIRSAARGALEGKRRWVLIAVLAASAVGWLWLGGGREASADSWLTSPAERGSLRNTVSATGTVQAVLTVQVGSQITGRIASLHADFNSVVKAGMILARIDPANFEAQLDRAKADLNDAKAGVRTADAAVATQEANLVAAKVAAADAERALRRARELGDQGVLSSRDLEVAQAASEQAAARVVQAESQVRSAQAGAEQARARLDQAKAAVKIAEINLYYTVISSPVDGVVISRSVDVGQTVSASLQAPTIFTIANDLTKMQVVASVDEADIGSIAPESSVSFTVDAFPGEIFSGSLNQIRLNPQTQQNVVTYSVIIDVANARLQLRPGMTANTTFTIAERAEALKIPNAALRYWPEGIPREKEGELIASAGTTAPAAPPVPSPSGGAQASETEPSRGERPGQASRGGAGGGGGGSWGGARKDEPAGLASAPASEATIATGVPAGEVIRFPAGKRTGARPRVLWILGSKGEPEPRVVKTGISDGSATEIVEGDLREGDVVIIGRNVSPESAAARGNSPFAPSMGPMGPRRGGAPAGARPGR